MFYINYLEPDERVPGFFTFHHLSLYEPYIGLALAVGLIFTACLTYGFQAIITFIMASKIIVRRTKHLANPLMQLV